MANAGVEYMAKRVSTLASLAINCKRELSPILSPSIHGVNAGRTTSATWALWRPETPAVATPCSIVFPLLSPLGICWS